MPTAAKGRSRSAGSKAKAGAKSSAAKAKSKAAESADESTEEEDDESKSNGRQRNTEPFPSGEELYNAKYVDGMTWAEIRENLDERIRSPKGLSLIAAYVIENGLEEEHPEFADLSELEDEEMDAAIVEWHDSGQGWAVLAARTGLGIAEVRDRYEEAGGENPGRVGGQRYGGGRSKAKGEEETSEGEESSDEEEKPKPARKRRARSKAANPSK